MKSKQELIEKWESAIEAAEFYGKGKEERLISYMKDFVSDLNQLDEPEVLSQEWIDGNKEPFHHFETNKVDYYVSADFLQNLLVPKQELPVIPQEVADWYENHKDNLEKQLGGIAYNLDKYGEMPEVNGLDKWINETEYPLQTLASLKYGYEVEKEPKYRLKLNGDYLSSVQVDYGAEEGKPIEVIILADVKGLPYGFSEDEKSYVEKYLNVKVEELEE